MRQVAMALAPTKEIQSPGCRVAVVRRALLSLTFCSSPLLLETILVTGRLLGPSSPSVARHESQNVQHQPGPERQGPSHSRHRRRTPTMRNLVSAGGPRGARHGLMHMAHVAPHSSRLQMVLDAMQEEDTTKRQRLLHKLCSGSSTTSWTCIQVRPSSSTSATEAAPLGTRAFSAAWAS